MFLLIFILIVPLFAIQNSIKISYQNLKFNEEKLGLIETSYLFHKNYLYSGISVFSAVNGKRGGFFTGGITTGMQIPFYKFLIDSSIFLGGGGGGSAPQGSGLMLKIDGGIVIPYKRYLFGISYNKIKFKDGAIDSNQIAFNFYYKFKDLFFLKPLTFCNRCDIAQIRIAPFLKEYFPSSKTTTNSKQKQFGVVGVELIRDFQNFSVILSGGGAFQGESDGYAEHMVGIEKTFKNLYLKGFIGSAGGGRVDTKNGLIFQTETGIKLSPFSLSIGYTKSNGSFKGTIAKINVYKNFSLITYGNKKLNFHPKKINLKTYLESYLPSPTIRKTNNNKRLDVFNIEIAPKIKENFYVIANAAAAVNGDSGGYAVGMFGIEFNNKKFFANILIGAAGGGSVDVGGGLITKANIGLKYKYLFFSTGYIKALQGNLSTPLISLGVEFPFYRGFI